MPKPHGRVQTAVCMWSRQKICHSAVLAIEDLSKLIFVNYLTGKASVFS